MDHLPMDIGSTEIATQNSEISLPYLKKVTLQAIKVNKYFYKYFHLDLSPNYNDT